MIPESRLHLNVLRIFRNPVVVVLPINVVIETMMWLIPTTILAKVWFTHITLD
jgi:hypothetical protein